LADVLTVLATGSLLCRAHHLVGISVAVFAQNNDVCKSRSSDALAHWVFVVYVQAVDYRFAALVALAAVAFEC
jgi:hypothetical protein